MNVNNNTAPFVSITWHQKESLSCVVYSHCPTNGSYSKCIHGGFLPCNYVTKPFGILQRVIKSQRVLISPYIWVQQKPISYLSEKFVVKFSDNFKFFQSHERVIIQKNFRPHTKVQFSGKNDISLFYLRKALFFFKIFEFLSWLFGHVAKWLDKKDKVNFKFYDVTVWLTNNCNTHIAQYLE